MPLPAISQHSPGDLVLSTIMADAGADGIGGATAGVCRFIAPIRSRIVSMQVAFRGVVSAPNGFRVDSANGTIGDAETQTSRIAPANAASFSGFQALGFGGANNILEAGQMFRVRSDGNSGASIPAAITVTLEPVGKVQYDGNLFAICGQWPDGVTIRTWWIRPPWNGCEILQCWTGLASTIGAATQSAVIQKNGASTVANPVMNAGGADLTVFTDASTALDADRFLSETDNITAFLTGSAGFTTEVPFTMLFRRL